MLNGTLVSKSFATSWKKPDILYIPAPISTYSYSRPHFPVRGSLFSLYSIISSQEVPLLPFLSILINQSQQPVSPRSTPLSTATCAIMPLRANLLLAVTALCCFATVFGKRLFCIYIQAFLTPLLSDLVIARQQWYMMLTQIILY